MRSIDEQIDAQSAADVRAFPSPPARVTQTGYVRADGCCTQVVIGLRPWSAPLSDNHASRFGSRSFQDYAQENC
eukprot:1360910-Pleurochrysis_carterae.AAC.1